MWQIVLLKLFYQHRVRPAYEHDAIQRDQMIVMDLTPMAIDVVTLGYLPNYCYAIAFDETNRLY